MNKKNIADWLRESKRKIISVRQATAYYGGRGYARLALSRQKKRGRLLLVKRGWWALPEASSEEAACEISAPCYISFHSALYLAGLTAQIPKCVQVAMTERAPKKYRAIGTEVVEIRLRKGKEFCGFSRNGGVLLASAQKAFADCLNYPRTCPKIVLEECKGEINGTQVEEFLSKSGRERFEKMMKDAGKTGA